MGAAARRLGVKSALRWRDESSSLPSLIAALLLVAAFAALTSLASGPLVGLDRALNHSWWREWPEPQPFLEIAVRLGQRAVCLPVLAIATVYYARREHAWGLVLLAGGSGLVLNLSVGFLKILTARGHPLTSDPSFFEQGIMYPSGHAANAVCMYGLVAYLAGHYGDRIALLCRVLTWAAAFTMVLTGLYFRWHWFTDLVAGVLLGGAVLAATICVHKFLLAWCRR